MRIVLRAVIALLLVTLVAGPAMADTTTLSRNDKTGDVRLYKTNVNTKTQKKSIDIRKASLTLLDNGRTRYKVRLKKLYKSKKWDQIVYFESTYAGDDPGLAAVSFKVRNSERAQAYDSVTDNSCDLKVKRKGRDVWVDVPAACSMHAGQTVRLTTYTGDYSGTEYPYSRDRLTLGKLPAQQ